MRLFSIIFLMMIGQFVFGQSSTSELYFNSADEKEYFDDLDQNTYFDLLFEINNNGTVKNLNFKNDFYALLDDLKLKYKSKKEQKRIQSIYNDIQDKYFYKYHENPNFNSIFSSGVYNCVSSTALFALAFEYLGIPYEIKQIPTHVYLIAHPDEYHIILQTTAAEAGYLPVSEKQIDDYKAYLVDNKFLTFNEAKAMTGNDIFHKFYSTDGTISLTELIGIQYYNTSINFYENGIIDQAYYHAEKALHLYPSKYTSDFATILLLTLLENNNSLKNDCSVINKLVKVKNEDKEYQKVILDYYNSNLMELKGSDEKLIKVEEYYTCLNNLSTENEIKSELISSTTLLLSEYYYNSLEYEKALQILAANYNPNKSNWNAIVQASFINANSRINDPLHALDSLAKYEKVFPFFKKDPHLLGFGVWCYMKLVFNQFELDNKEAGLAHLNKFKDLYKPQGEAYYNDEFIGNGFGAASAYFVRKNDWKKALSILDEGLLYCPGSLELLRKREFLEE